MQAHERHQDFPKQQLVDKALHSIIILLTKKFVLFLDHGGIEAFPRRCRDCGHTTVNMLLILPTTVLVQTMNNMKQCIMKSTVCMYLQ